MLFYPLYNTEVNLLWRGDKTRRIKMYFILFYRFHHLIFCVFCSVANLLWLNDKTRRIKN